MIILGVYATRCGIWSDEDSNVIINGGIIVSIANSLWGNVTNVSNVSIYYAYALISGGETVINNIDLYGYHGGVCVNDNNITFNGGSFKASDESLDKYAEVNTNIWVQNNKATKTYDLSQSEFMSSAKTALFNGIHYGLYAAGEVGRSQTRVNDGYFYSARLYALYVGNNNVGDGGNREYAEVYIAGGKFMSAVAGTVCVDYAVSSLALIGGVFGDNIVNANKANKTLTDIVSSGYRVAENSDGTYSIVAK